MKSFLNALSTNQKLALLAFVLGLVALLGQPSASTVVSLDTRDLARIVDQQVDHVTVDDLSTWIIEGRADYRLIDVREEEAYAAYHIPTAEHVPVGQLPDYGLNRNEQVILYSDGGIHAAQAWFLLKAMDYKSATTLLGGLDAWKDEVLFPSLPENPGAAELAAVERAERVSRFFGGSPRTGGGLDETGGVPMVMPKVEMPAAPVGVQPTKKKRREGC